MVYGVIISPNRPSVSSTVAHIFSLFSEFKSSGELWSVTPSTLSIDLTSSPEENNQSQCRLKVINYSNKELPFECYCPTGNFLITPCKDRVPPHSQLGIRIDPKRAFLPKLNMPHWSGHVTIVCGDEKKVFALFEFICPELDLSSAQTKSFGKCIRLFYERYLCLWFVSVVYTREVD